MNRRVDGQEQPIPGNIQELVERGERAKWWRRVGTKRRGFRYVDARGEPITQEKQLERIRALVLPPAWTEVRIAPSVRSRLQAVGVDAMGRLQYRYDAKYTAQQAEKKYAKIVRFGEALPALRKLTNAHIALEGFPKEKVLAVMIRLINDLYFRLGSEQSVTRYRTFGITTLRNRHLRILPDGTLEFNFIGKHHIHQRQLYVDAELAALMAEIKAIRGSRLFNWLDPEDRPHAVTPYDINHYIKAATGPEFSGKDFRTWGGTLEAAIVLAEMGPAGTERQIKRNIVAAAKRVAERLGNTPTVCRDCYIHPTVFARYREGVTLADFRPRSQRAIRRCQPEYETEEIALLELLHQTV